MLSQLWIVFLILSWLTPIIYIFFQRIALRETKEMLAHAADELMTSHAILKEQRRQIVQFTAVNEKLTTQNNEYRQTYINLRTEYEQVRGRLQSLRVILLGSTPLDIERN